MSITLECDSCAAPKTASASMAGYGNDAIATFTYNNSNTCKTVKMSCMANNVAHIPIIQVVQGNRPTVLSRGSTTSPAIFSLLCNNAGVYSSATEMMINVINPTLYCVQVRASGTFLTCNNCLTSYSRMQQLFATNDWIIKLHFGH